MKKYSKILNINVMCEIVYQTHLVFDDVREAYLLETAGFRFDTLEKRKKIFDSLNKDLYDKIDMTYEIDTMGLRDYPRYYIFKKNNKYVRQQIIKNNKKHSHKLVGEILGFYCANDDFDTIKDPINVGIFLGGYQVLGFMCRKKTKNLELYLKKKLTNLTKAWQNLMSKINVYTK